MSAPLTIKRRERDAILQSLQAGLVPKQGLHLIQVGRKAEVTALLGDVDRIAEGGAASGPVVLQSGVTQTFSLAAAANGFGERSTPERTNRIDRATAVPGRGCVKANIWTTLQMACLVGRRLFL